MKLLFCGGSGKRAYNCLDILVNNNKEVASVILGQERRAEIGALELISLSDKAGIPVSLDTRVNSEDGLRLVREYSPELIVMAAFNPIVGNKFLSIPKLGCINLHGGKLPEYRGSSPRNWAIVNGEKNGCCSIVKVNPNEYVDAGEIIAQELYPIKDSDTIADVLKKDAEFFPRLLLDVVNKIEEEGKVEGVKQGKGTYWHRRRKEDKKIDWTKMTSEQVRNLVRAETRPYEGAWTTYQGRELKVFRVERVTDQNYRGTPGRIIKFPKMDPIVLCTDDGIYITDVELEGERIDPKSLKNYEFLV